MDIPILPGSPFLQACFYGLAAAIVIATALTLRGAAAVQRRFLIGSLIWVSLVSAAAFAGLLLPRTGQPPLPFVVMLVSIIVLGVAISRSRAGERLARAPLAWLVLFQSFRLPLELAMHRAYTEGLMPEQMSYSGRNFDIVTGATALALGLAMMVIAVPRWIVAAWNVLGLLLLANILVVAMLSTPVFAYFGPDRLNVFVMSMPYTLLPAVMVLAAWAGHLIIFRALSLRAA